jgi:hypothetical protein
VFLALAAAEGVMLGWAAALFGKKSKYPIPMPLDCDLVLTTPAPEPPRSRTGVLLVENAD